MMDLDPPLEITDRAVVRLVNRDRRLVAVANARGYFVLAVLRGNLPLPGEEVTGRFDQLGRTVVHVVGARGLDVWVEAVHATREDAVDWLEG